eukprot:12064825-Alexandrium_andersonii.AAC.1
MQEHHAQILAIVPNPTSSYPTPDPPRSCVTRVLAHCLHAIRPARLPAHHPHAALSKPRPGQSFATA